VQNNLGTFLFERGRHAEATAQYRQAIARNASSEAFWMNLARALAAAGDWTEAEAVRREIVARWPSARSHLLLGSLLQDRGRHAEARETFEEALRRAPDDPMVHRYLAAVYRALEGDASPSATQHARRAATLVSRSTDRRTALVYLRRGFRCARLGSAEAIWQFKRSAALDPTLAEAPYNLGVAYLAMDPPRRDLARPALERAVALGFAVPDAIREQLDASLSGEQGNR
jgi:tetratricopeptide (TPR) repeat protein